MSVMGAEISAWRPVRPASGLRAQVPHAQVPHAQVPHAQVPHFASCY